MAITEDRRLPEPSGRSTTSSGVMEQLLFEVKRMIVGQDALVERLLVAILAGGHVLLEGVPGPAKTMTIKTLAQVLGGKFGRVQFTPDLVPADLSGTRIYNMRANSFTTELGPIFANLLLADEINRAPAKVQSALLEAMQEHQVTIGQQTFPVPQPFFVLATQNPIESDGTYPLPEAQLDRFMFKVVVDYPTYEDEVVVVQRVLGQSVEVRTLLCPEDILKLQDFVAEIYVDPRVIEYAVTVVEASRRPNEHGLESIAPAIMFGGSPRASINLIAGARALAFIRGRDYILPQDVAELARDVLRHRLILTYEGIAAGITPDRIVSHLLDRYPPPRMDLGDRYVA